MNKDSKLNLTEVNEITEKVIGCPFKVSNTLGGRISGKGLRKCGRIEIARSGLNVRQQIPIDVKYDGVIVGQFLADLLVADPVIVEFKAIRLLEDVHTAQCLNYLCATGLPICLLINFFRPKLEIKRLVASEAWLRH
jgi:GxxExxY protein